MSNWHEQPELKGLKLFGQQAAAAGGRLDLLAHDLEGKSLVVIELKRGHVGGEVVEQIERYLGSPEVRRLAGKSAVRGVAIARGYLPGARHAARRSPYLIELWTFSGDRDQLRLHRQ